MQRMMLYLAALVLAACLPAGLMSSLTIVPPTAPNCTPMMMPTGEQYYPVVLAEPLPAPVHAGATYRFRLTGGLLLPQPALDCGGTYPTLLPILPGTPETTMRFVRLKLADTTLYDQLCAYDCTVEFTVPADFAPGIATFTLEASVSRATYPVKVLPAAP
jgi:hypothetical protein